MIEQLRLSTVFTLLGREWSGRAGISSGKTSVALPCVIIELGLGLHFVQYPPSCSILPFDSFLATNTNPSIQRVPESQYHRKKTRNLRFYYLWSIPQAFPTFQSSSPRLNPLFVQVQLRRAPLPPFFSMKKIILTSFGFCTYLVDVKVCASFQPPSEVYEITPSLEE